MANIPAIRFKGFTDPWEQRKLGEMFEESDLRSPTEEILSVSVAKGIYPASESDRETNPGASLVNYKVVRKGDIVYNSMRMWQGAVGSSNYDGIVSPAYVVARPRVKLDSDCFGYLLKQPQMLYKYLCDSQGNSKDTQTLKYERFAEIEADIPPTLKEQQLISGSLKQLDILITLHQRKYEKLSVLKKSLLEKMFPREGENKPEIRFAGFTDPWEQRKLGELLVERNQQSPMSDEYPLMAFIANEGITPKGKRYDRSALVSDTLNKLYKKTEIGDFIYSSNNLETGSIGLNKYGKACISPVYSIFKPTNIVDSDFLGRRLVRKDFINAMVKWRQGVIYGQWRIHESDFLKIEIPVPSVEEQRKIGAYLDQLDNLITLHQRKLEKLKQLKQSLLEKMFV